VIDEVLGYFLAIMFHKVTIPFLLAAFVLFRIYDILKPFPANQVQDVKGGAGVVLDDLVAGLYANATLTLIVFVQSFFGICIL
jgi:phosphatidylglycerophosphatase A